MWLSWQKIKSNNLQYNMLGRWFTAMNDSSTNGLMFQVFFFSLFLAKFFAKIISIYFLFFQEFLVCLGRWVIRLSDPASQRIILKIVGFIILVNKRMHLFFAKLSKPAMIFYATHCKAQFLMQWFYFLSRSIIRSKQKFIN